jgi:hypothetical protein
MSGYTGPTGPIGIDGIYGQQGAIGSAGVRGNLGPTGDFVPNPKMLYQSFYVTGETGLTGGALGDDYLLRAVYTTALPPLIDSKSIGIQGMETTNPYVLSVPAGTYLVQASSVGINYLDYADATSSMAIAEVGVTTTCFLAGLAIYGLGVPLMLDGVLTLTTTTDIELRNYASASVINVRSDDESTNSWTSFISFMKIQ